MKSKTSVVMAVGGQFEHNRLMMTVESVLGQTYGEFELIIIDDTRDGSILPLLQRYLNGDPRIIPLTNGDNIGLTKSLNRGIQRATGQYIARIDAEDLWDRTKLSKQVEFLENNPDYVICGTDGNFINPRGEIISEFQTAMNDEQLRKRILTRARAFLHPSIVFRNIGIYYRDFFYYSQDLDLYIRLMFQGKMHNIQEKLTFKMVSTHSISIEEGYYLQRKYQNICYRLLRERIKYGYDRLDRGIPPLIKKNRIGVFFSLTSNVFFRKYLYYYNRHKVLARFYYIISLFIYIPALFDFIKGLIGVAHVKIFKTGRPL